MFNKSLILAVLLVAAAQSANAASYYVATTGNDANPGTAALPFRTITRGVNALRPGDMLSIRGGTYAEKLHNLPSGTASAPITIASYPGETAVIRPAVSDHIIYLEGVSYLVFDRLVFDGSALIPNSNYKCIFIAGSTHHVRVQHSELKNAVSSGVSMDRGASHNEFVNLSVHDNGVSGLDHGIYLRGSNNLVEKSDIYRNAGFGVQIYSSEGAGVANGNTIRNNNIHENSFGEYEWGAGITIGSGNNNLVYNNLIWVNGGGGIKIAYGAPTGSMVYNNTIYANDKFGIRIDSDGRNSVIKNNILYQNNGTQLDNRGTGTQASHNLIGVDPAFVNLSEYDFHLRSGSPAIDAGTSVTTVTTDFDGNPRPQGATWDIGAFEFLAGGSVPLAPTQVIIRP